MSGGEAGDESGGSVIGDVAKDTATDVLTSALGSGVPGQVVSNYRRRSSWQRSPSAQSVSLASGTQLQIFLRESVDALP